MADYAPFGSAPPTGFSPYAGVDGAALTGGESGDALHKILLGIIGGTVALPQRAIGASAADVGNLGDHSHPLHSVGPALETALTMMGGGVAGTGERAAGQTLGAGMISGSGPEAKAAWSALRAEKMEERAAIKKLQDALQGPMPPRVDPYAGMSEEETAKAFEQSLRSAKVGELK